MRAVAAVDSVRVLLRLQATLCFLAILFASGDIWPSVTIGFNFRFSQLCLLLALALSPALLWKTGVRWFPGWHWLYLFSLWLFATLPFSLFVPRSVGYTFWAVTDALIIFVFVQTFRTEARLVQLMNYFVLGFTLVALFGLMQFALGLFGVNVLVTQWWIPGALPRINGISYEPSYYATYLLGGWVLSWHLLEEGATIPDRRVLKMCLLMTTAALLLATSRLGWGMMLLWIVLRALRWGARAVAGTRMRWRTAGVLVALPLVLVALLAASSPMWPRLTRVVSEASFLLSGLGLFGAPAHSAKIRASDLRETWDAFLAHPLIGTGIGAVPAEIAADRLRPLRKLEEAKPNEGMSIFVELLASTGLVGLALLTGFAVSVVRACKRIQPLLPPWRSRLLRGMEWSLIWVLLALQFSQNILRIWLFVDLAVLICCLTASRQLSAFEVGPMLRPVSGWSAQPPPRSPMHRPVKAMR